MNGSIAIAGTTTAPTAAPSSYRVPRRLAGLLLEYVLPGQRHASFPLRPESLPLSPQAYFPNSTTQPLVRKFKVEYENVWFAEYLERGQFTSSVVRDDDNYFLSNENDNDDDSATTPSSLLLDLPAARQQIHFERILSEIRKCTGIVEWLRPNHAHTNFTLASPRVATAAREWTLADDAGRRRALLETADSWEEDPLTRAVVAAYGGKQHCEQAIHRCLRDLVRLCRLPFQIPDAEYHQFYKIHANFNLTRSTAKYYTRLFNLDLDYRNNTREGRIINAWSERDVEITPRDYPDYTTSPKRSKRMRHFFLY